MPSIPESRIALTMQELLAVVGVCRTTVYAEMAAGRLVGRKVGARLLFRHADVVVWTDWALGLRHETRGGVISEAEAFSLFSELSAKHFKYDFDKTNERWRSASTANARVCD